MALIDCPECQSVVSDSASACPHCGHSNPGKVVEKVSSCRQCGRDIPIASLTCPYCDFKNPAHKRPRSATRQVPAGRKLTELEKWFGFAGRISRAQFWGRYLLAQVAGFALGVVLGLYWPDVFSDGFLEVVARGLGTWMGLALGWKRAQDQNLHGSVSLLGLIPLLGLVVMLFVGLRSGTNGPNEYGPKPGYKPGHERGSNLGSRYSGSSKGENNLLGSEVARRTTDQSAIRELSNVRDWIVRKGVAQNPHASPGTLSRLASDSVRGVRAASARNPSLPSSDLKRLAGDKELVVRRAALEALAKLTVDNAEPADSGNGERRTVDSETTSDSHAHLVSNVIETLERLGSLRKDGHLSEEEFENLKQQVLESSSDES